MKPLNAPEDENVLDWVYKSLKILRTSQVIDSFRLSEVLGYLKELFDDRELDSTLVENYFLEEEDLNEYMDEVERALEALALENELNLNEEQN